MQDVVIVFGPNRNILLIASSLSNSSYLTHAFHSLWLLFWASPPVDCWMLCPVVFPGLLSLLLEEAM